ncbi:MAG: exosortase/archaeosortase family protein [Candidatus Bathyarchaeia archaeon]
MKKLGQCFSKALTNIRTYYKHILAVFLTLSLIFIVYWRDLEVLVNEALNTESLTHVLIIPFLASFLFYRKREMVKASLALDKLQKPQKTRYIDGFVGLSLCLIAFLLYWYGSYTFHPLEYHIFSLPIFVAGITLILFNLKTLKALIFPILFLLFLVPFPQEVMSTLGGSLANFNTQASYALLKPFGIPVTLSTAYGAPTILLKTSVGHSTSFSIDLPCSGIYTFIALTMFAAFLALTVSTSASKKILIFAIGFAIFEALNIVRITTIISAAYFFGEEVAMLIFHSFVGLFLTFVGMLLTLFASEKLLKINFLSKADLPKCLRCKKLSKQLEDFCLNCGVFLNSWKWRPSQTFWAKLLVLLLGCSAVVFSINAPVFAIAKDEINIKSTWENITDIFPVMYQYELKFLYRDVNYERVSKQDASLVYAYFPSNFSEPPVYVLVSVANSISNLHNWEVCLISWQTSHGQYPLVKVLDSRDIQLLESPIIARYLVFQNTGQNYTQVTLYWYEKITFKIGATVQQKYVRISLIILTGTLDNYKQYEDQLLDFGKVIASYLEPIKTRSLISLGIPAQQTLLILSIIFIITTKSIQSINEWRKRINNLKIFTNYASPKDKLVLEAITEISKAKKSVNTADINDAIKTKTGKYMKIERLVERLNRLQEYGFIKMGITPYNNKPILVWKSLVDL